MSSAAAAEVGLLSNGEEGSQNDLTRDHHLLKGQPSIMSATSRVVTFQRLGRCVVATVL
jgi:hypothetical protein